MIRVYKADREITGSCNACTLLGEYNKVWVISIERFNTTLEVRLCEGCMKELREATKK